MADLIQNAASPEEESPQSNNIIQELTSPNKDMAREADFQSLILETMSEGICLIHRVEQTILYANRAFALMFGYEVNELKGKEINSLIQIKWERTPGIINGLTSDGEAAFEIENLRKDGSRFWCRIHSTYRQHPEYGLVQLIRCADISSYKNAEIELEQKTIFLELLKLVSLIANEATTIEEAGQLVIELICNFIQWSVGHIYLIGANSFASGELTNLWYDASPTQFSSFRESAENLNAQSLFQLADEFSGKDKILFIFDINDPISPRSEAAKRVGINSGFAFPIKIDDRIAGVMEFFTTEVTIPNKQQIELMVYIGTQLGYVIGRKRNEEILYRRDAILAAGNFAIEHLLKTPDWTTGIDIVLERLVEVTGVSGVALFKNYFHVEGVELTSRIYKWLGPANSKLDEFALQDISLKDLGFRDWEEKLVLGEIISGSTNDLRGRQREILDKTKTKSFVIIPILSGNHCWGFIAFFDSYVEREWSTAELAALKTATGILEAAIVRRRVENERDRFFTIGLDLLCIAGTDGYFKQLNPAFERVLGYTNAELLNKPFLEIIHPDDHAATIAEGAKLARGIPSLHFENRYRCKNGTYKWLVWTTTPDPTEGVLYSAGHDITDYKLLQEELEHKNEILREQNIQVQETNRMKSAFLANTSHELRTPLNGIIGMTELLLSTDLTVKQRSYAEIVRQSGENLLIIINDILDFSKIEAGKLRFETINFDLISSVEDITTLLAERAHAKNLELNNLIDNNVPSLLRGDPFRISQILLNLIGNGIKFTRQGEILLRIKCIDETPHDCLLRFEVSDTGIGISAADQGRLFQPFAQTDASYTRKYGGTGLGLVISSQLVNLMDGQIGVNSQPGKGSTFWFTLRLEKQSSDILPGKPTQRDLHGLNVLIVDDNATNRTILYQQILNWNMRGKSVETGISALDLLHNALNRGDPYDLIILDMQMPDMNGLELARLIKTDPSFASIGMILLTSVGQQGVPEEAKQIGIDCCLTKPARQAELYNCLVSIITKPTGDTSGTDIIADAGEKKERPKNQVRILVAEDNPVNQLVAVGMLEARGYHTDMVANGLEAMEALTRIPYSAILMDCQMPEMDGYTATKEIRKKENGLSHIPIIAMTANALKGEREKCLAAGMDDYIAKPVKKEELYRILDRWLALTASNQPRETKLPDDLEPVMLDPLILNNLRSLKTEKTNTILQKLVSLFEEDTPERLATIRKAIVQHDVETITTKIHALKGSCGNFGATQMMQICNEIEIDVLAHDFPGISELITRLEIEYKKVCVALHKTLLEDPPNG